MMRMSPRERSSGLCHIKFLVWVSYLHFPCQLYSTKKWAFQRVCFCFIAFKLCNATIIAPLLGRNLYLEMCKARQASLN